MMRQLSFTFVFSILLLAGPHAEAAAPDFNLRTPEGKRVNLKQLLEKGPVLLDFWATYCKPCIKAMPKLEALHQKYQQRGLTVLGINEDGPRSQSKIRPFLKTREITFPTALDPDGGVMRRFQVVALPATFLIAQDGEILLRQAGYTEENAQALLTTLQSLLPEPKNEQTPAQAPDKKKD